MLLGTVAGGVGTTTTIQLQYVPQFLYMPWPAAPTLIQMNVTDDGTPINIDAAGSASLRNIGFYTSFAATIALFQIANGEIAKPKGVNLVITNSNAAAFNVYGFSLTKGNAYVRYLPVPLLANSSNNIDKFSYLSMPALAATDIVDVSYMSGQVQRLTDVELQFYNSIYENRPTGNIVLSNLQQNIKSVNLQVTLAQTIYKVDYQLAGNATAPNRTY